MNTSPRGDNPLTATIAGRILPPRLVQDVVEDSPRVMKSQKVGNPKGARGPDLPTSPSYKTM